MEGNYETNQVNKAALIGQLMKKHRYTRAAATCIVEDFTDIVMENLRNGNTVALKEFGKFTGIKRKAHTCPNMQTGETIEIPAHYIARFYPSAAMSRMVQEWEAENCKD